jgi:hypothetical protein
VHKLAALRLLGRELSKLEAERLRRIETEGDPATANREAAQLGLNAVLTFFQDYDIETGALVPLLADLAALSDGSRPSAMLKPAVTGRRPADSPGIEGLKGRLAAIMEFRQQQGLTRIAAGEWVVRHAPARMKHTLPLSKRATLDSWLVKWGGKHGSPSSGREGYVAMQAILDTQKPNEQQLRKILATLVRWLPA